MQRGVLALAVSAAFGASVHANPSGQSVASGSASFAVNGKTLSVTNTPGAIINWQQFSIGKDEVTRFIQQNAASAVLNRVIGQDPSVILGQLLSNGRVFLINPSGIAFGRGAVIDVAGLVASTLNLTDADFLSGRMRFGGAGGEGKLGNAGTINTRDGGQVYLIAPNLENQPGGVINAPGGEVMIVAGRTVELVDARVPEIRVEYTAPQSEAVNAGQVVAAGGRVGIYGTLIRNSGLVSASRASVGEGGRIVLAADRDVTLEAASRLEASGAKGGSVRVQAHGGTLLASGVIEAKGSEDKGGEVQLLGTRVGLVGNALVDASGERGGGTVLVGGDFQGKNPDVQNATKTYIARDVTIRADALADGDGGKVVVWADDWTKYYGSISARGGGAGGNGGSVEVSGKRELDFNGVVDVLAAHGKAGSVLLDPGSITIVPGASGDGGDDGGVAGGTVTFTDGAAAPFTISAGALEALSGNITLQSQAQTDVNASLNLSNQTAGTTVTFQAGGNMNVNQPITTAGGKLILVAGDPAYNASSPSPALIIASGANLTTNGGDISLLNQKGTGGTGIGIGADVNAGAGTVRITDSSSGIGQQAGTAITAAALGISSVGAVTLNQANNVGTLAANVTGPGSAFSFKNAIGLTVGSVSAGYSSTALDGLSVAAGGGGISLTVTGASNDLTLNGAVNGNAGTVTLNAAGLISQTATGTINTSGALTGSTGTTATLDQGNTIGSLGAFSANGNFSLNDTAGGLTLTGPLGAGTGAVTVATAGGALALGANNVTGVGVSLTGRGVTQSSGSTVAAGAGNVTVVGSDGTKGAINLDGAITGANVTVRDASSAALGNVTTAGTLTVGVGADLSGAVTQNANRVLSAGTLTGSTASSVALGNANTIGSLGAFTTNGAFTLNDAGGGLGVTGAVTTTNNGLASITTTGGNLAVTTGSVAGNGVTLTANGAGSDITLNGAVNGNAGTVTLTAADQITQTATGLINTTGTLTLNAGGAVTLDQANAIANLGAVTRGGALTVHDTTGGLNVTGAITAGTTTNPVRITTAGGALSIGASITASGGTGDLSLTGVGVDQTAGSLVAGGTTTVNAGTGSIALNSATNNFTGAVTLNATGANVSIRDTNDLTLAAPTLEANTGITAIAGATLTFPAGNLSTGTGNIDLRANGGTLATFGTLTTSTGTITLVGSAGLTVGHNITSISGNVSLTGGGVTVNTGRTVNAGSATILIDGNNGAITLNDSMLTTTSNLATAVQIIDATTATLGNIITGTTGTLVLGGATTDNLSSTVTQTPGTAIGAGTLTGNTGSTAVLDQGNTIANLGAFTTNGAFTLNDAAGGLNVTGAVTTTNNGLASITTTGGNLAVTTGSVAGNGVTLTANGAGSDLTLNGAVNGNAGTVTLTAADQITQTATGLINTTGTLTGGAGTTATLDRGNTIGGLGAFTTNGAFTLNDAGGGLSVTGAVNSGSGATTITATGGTLSLAGSGSVTGAGVSLVNNDGGIALGGGVTASGGSALSLTATAGIDQTAGAIGAGAGTLDGGNGAIVLARPANDFTGTVTLKNAGASNDVTIVDVNALTIGASAIGRNLDVTAPIGMTLAGTIGSGGTQSYRNAVIIGAPSTLSSTAIGAAGNMNFASTVEGGSGGLTVNTAGTTTFTGSVGSVTPVASLQLGAGGATTIGAGGLVKTSGAQTYGSPVTITANTQLLTTGGGDIALDGGLTGTNLTLTLGGSGTPAGNVTGTSLALGTTSGTLNLQKIATNASFTGTVTAGTISVPDSVNNMSLTGNATQVTNPVDFENTGNTTLGAAGGSQTYTGGFTTNPVGVTFLNGTLSTGGTAAQSLSFNDAVQLSTATTLNPVAAPVTFASTLDGPGGLIVNTSGTTQFSGNVGNSSRLGSLETKGGGLTNFASGLAVRTSGTQSFGDQVTAADLTIDGSGTGAAGAITATNPLNDFSGTLAVTGGTTQIVDRNSLTLGAVNITGTASFTANDGSITTGGAGNPFRASGDITLIAKDAGAAQSTAGSITIDAAGLASTGGGKVNLYAADNVTVVDPGASRLPGDVNGVQSNGGQITILAGQTPGMLANPGTETVADGFGKVLINAPLNAGATGNVRIVTAGTGLVSVDSNVTQGARGGITANVLSVVTLKDSGVPPGGGAEILLNGATAPMNQVSTISMLSCTAIGCPVLAAEPVPAGVPPLGSLIQSPAGTQYANGLLRYTGISPAGVPVDISGIGTTNDFFAFVTGPFNLTAFPFSANNVTLEAVGTAGTITLNLANPLTKINDSGSGTLSFIAGGDINLLNTATSSIGKVSPDGSVSLFNHNLVMTAAGNINIDNSIFQGARNLTIAADAAFRTANQNTFACPTPATCSLLGGNGTGMDGIGNVTMMGNHVISTGGDVTITGRGVSLWGKGAINALGVADPTLAPAGTNPSGQELTVAGTINLLNSGVISVLAGTSSASSRSGARLTARTVNIGASDSPNNPTRLDIVGGDNSLGFATDDAHDPVIELRQADAKIESLRNMFIYLRKDASVPDAFGNPTSLRIVGGTATANNTGAPMLYVTALGALRAERIELVADGSLLIQGGTSVLQSSNALSLASAVLLAKDYKKITTNALGSLVIKGGTAEVTSGVALKAQALAQLDPSELILDIAGNLVLQGGTGPLGSQTSARIDAGGNLLITTHGPAGMQYTYVDTQSGSRTLPGGVVMIGGGGSGIFDAANVPLQGTGVPITINILNGGGLTRAFDFGRDDAVIRTGRNVFDQSLLNYLIFAANEAGATRRIRSGSKGDDDEGGAACN